MALTRSLFSFLAAFGLGLALLQSAKAQTPTIIAVPCDGTTDTSATVNAQISVMNTVGGTLLFPGLTNPCKMNSTPTWVGTGKWIRLLVQGTLDLRNGTTLQLGTAGAGFVELAGDEAGGGPLQFAWKPTASIIPPNYVGTLGTSVSKGSTTAVTPSLTSGTISQMVPGAAVSVGYAINTYVTTPVFSAGSQTVNVTNTNNITTSTSITCDQDDPETFTPSGVVAGTSFTATFARTHPTYNFKCWGGNFETVTVVSISGGGASFTPSANWQYNHASSDPVGMVGIRLLGSAGGVIRNISISGCSGACIFLDQANNSTIEGVQSFAAQNVPTSEALEVNDTFWVNIANSVFSGNPATGTSYPYSVHFTGRATSGYTGLIWLMNSTLTGGGMAFDGVTFNGTGGPFLFSKVKQENAATEYIFCLSLCNNVTVEEDMDADPIVGFPSSIIIASGNGLQEFTGTWIFRSLAQPQGKLFNDGAPSYSVVFDNITVSQSSSPSSAWSLGAGQSKYTASGSGTSTSRNDQTGMLMLPQPMPKSSVDVVQTPSAICAATGSAVCTTSSVSAISFTTSASVTTVGSQTVNVSSTTNVANGSVITCDTGKNAELTMVISFVAGISITASFTKPHASGMSCKQKTPVDPLGGSNSVILSSVSPPQSKTLFSASYTPTVGDAFVFGGYLKCDNSAVTICSDQALQLSTPTGSLLNTGFALANAMSFDTQFVTNEWFPIQMAVWITKAGSAGTLSLNAQAYHGPTEFYKPYLLGPFKIGQGGDFDTLAQFQEFARRLYSVPANFTGGVGRVYLDPAICFVWWPLNAGGTTESPLADFCRIATSTIGTHGNMTAATYQVQTIPTIYSVASDFTTANNTFLQPITGLSWTVPANTAVNIPFTCELMYSQATAAVLDQFGIQDLTVAPTNIAAKAEEWTSATALHAGNLPTLNTTTPTAIDTFRPSATATVFNARVTGFIEQPSNAASSAIQIMVQTSNGGDAVTIKRGSFCKLF